MKNKKILALVAALILLTTLASGCKKVTPKVTEDPAKKLTAYEIQWYYPGSGPQKDTEVVEAELNKYLTKEINATIKMNCIDWKTFDQKIPAMIAAGEPMDVVFTSYWSAGGYSMNSVKGAFEPMDELMSKYAPKTKALFKSSYLEGTKINGKMYAVSANKDKAHNYALVYNKGLADKYGIDLSKVKTQDDILPLLEEVKQKAPSIIPFGHKLNPYFFTTAQDIIMGGFPAAIYTDGRDNKIYYSDQTPEIKKAYEFIRQVQQKGLTRADSATYQNWDIDWNQGKVFCQYVQSKPGLADETTTTNTNGQKYVQIDLDKPIVTNAEVTGSMMAISRTSKDKARAMMFLELLNTDKYVNNLVNYGVEGTHYTKVSDNVIKVTDKSAFTNAGMQWMYGNQFINYIVQGENPDKWNIMDKWNDVATPSPALGFVFNPEPVKSEIAAVGNAGQQYGSALYEGIVDPVAVEPKYEEALKKAGVEKVIAEMQKQYDAWRSSKK